jgi:hypothetical protein
MTIPSGVAAGRCRKTSIPPDLNATAVPGGHAPTDERPIGVSLERGWSGSATSGSIHIYRDAGDGPDLVLRYTRPVNDLEHDLRNVIRGDVRFDAGSRLLYSPSRDWFVSSNGLTG